MVSKAPGEAHGQHGQEGEVVIEVRDLTNRFGRQVVHHKLNLDVYRGEILGVIGGSGSGKSVLLRSIVGLQTPASGNVRVLGQDFRAWRLNAGLPWNAGLACCFRRGRFFLVDSGGEYCRPPD